MEEVAYWVIGGAVSGVFVYNWGSSLTLVACHFVRRGFVKTLRLWLALADEIGKLFPDEESEIYSV
ncbi:hypothetical protein BDZ91DRAFT_793493 [Kalaharituber pfeilii]|nr:hypothetical protein BDZ91DRAFT_793493 [Kalaharituber pfeilii]